MPSLHKQKSIAAHPEPTIEGPQPEDVDDPGVGEEGVEHAQIPFSARICPARSAMAMTFFSPSL